MKFNMATDAENYSPNTPAGYFSLKNDGDSAQIRIVYSTINDVEGHCVHKVQTNNGWKYVECLREYDDPQDMCPLCASENEADRKLLSKIWVPIYRVAENDIVLWERGKNFWQNTLYPLMVEKGEPFCANIFTITRNGVQGSLDTTYDFTFEGCDDTTIDNFDEIPQNSFVLEKSYDELEKFVMTRSFDDVDTKDASQFPRRRTSENAHVEESVPRRRGTTRPNINV